MNRTLKEVDSNPRGWRWRVQDFTGGSDCRCGRNSEKLELEVETEHAISWSLLFNQLQALVVLIVTESSKNWLHPTQDT